MDILQVLQLVNVNNSVKKVLLVSLSVVFIINSNFLNASSKKENKTHIQNPLFEGESRYKIIQDQDIETENEEPAKPLEKSEEKKEDLSQRSQTIEFSSTDITQTKSSTIQRFLQSKGFLIMSTGGNGSKSELSYKGFTSFCVKVYVNGILANNSSTGEFDWNSIDLNSIEKIQIDEIPSFSDSEFAGCVVRITTKKITEKDEKNSRLLADFSSSSFERSFLDTFDTSIFYSSIQSDFNYNIGAKLSSSKNEFERSEHNYLNENNFSRIGNFLFDYSKPLNERLLFSGFHNFSYNHLKAYNTGSDLNTGIETDISTNNAIKLSYKNPLCSIFSDSTLSFNFGNVEYINDKKSDLIDNTTFSKISVDEVFSHYLDCSTGVNYEFSGENSRITIKNALAKKFYFFSKAMNNQQNTNTNFESEKQNKHHSEKSEIYIEPQIISLIWKTDEFDFTFLPRVNFYAYGFNFSVFRLCTLPTFNQLYWKETDYAKGNPNLQCEEGWTTFLGFRQTDFPLFMQYSFSYYKNKIRWGSENSKLFPVNLGEAIYNTATIGFNKKWEIKITPKSEDLKAEDLRFAINSDVTFTNANLLPDFNQIMWVPKWQSHVNFFIEYKNFSINTDYAFVGKRFISNENLHSYPAYHLVDFTISYKITREFESYFKVNNLLDQRIAYHDDYYMQSRKITFGVRMEK